MTDLNHDILQNKGGVENNNLKNILECFELSKDESHEHFITSNYYDFDGSVKLLSQHGQNFNILTLNIEGLNAKFDNLSTYIDMLSEKNVKFDVIALQETWLAENSNVDIFAIPGYNLIHQGYKCGRKGGLAIYLKDIYNFSIYDIYKDSKHWEGLFIDITGGNLACKVTVANIYRPPRDNNSNASIEIFLDPLRHILKSLKRGNSTVIFAGDFNINLLQIQEREKFQEYFDLLTTHNLLPQITLPTRFSKRKGTLIDQIFCKFSGKSTTAISGIMINKLSDHLPCFSSLNIKKAKKTNPKYVQVTLNTPEAIEAFKEDVKYMIRSTSFENNLLTDPNITYTKLDNILQSAKIKHLPQRNVKFNKYKHKINPWMTSGILYSMKYRDKLYKNLKSTNPESSVYIRLEESLKSFCSILQKTIRAAKHQYYQKQFELCKSDIRKTWSKINEIISKNKKMPELPQYFINKDKIITDKTDIANCFNNFFVNIGLTLSEAISVPSNKSYTNYLTDQIACSFNFKLVTKEETIKIINKLHPKSSFGQDNISTILLKSISLEIYETLTLIINQSLSTGIFPDKLKIAKIKPIFKKENPHIPDNYRPISLLPAISKVFEKIVFIQVYEYFMENKLLYTSQYGFRTLHSTELAALELSDKIYLQMDKKETPLAIFLDLSKAFDTIDHSILLNKLQYYGIKNTSFKWFSSYLTNRLQYVQYDGQESDLSTITTGVPQGSILGPLLFIIYMNDIHKVTDKFNFILYADDTSLVEPLCTFNYSVKDNINDISQNINAELDAVYEWLSLNKLSLNIKKTKMMLFHHRQKNIKNIIPKLMINKVPIEYVTEFNFLGITLDECMTWNRHINRIACKMSCTIGTLKRLKRLLPFSVLKMLYNSLILPYINYGILVWGTNTQRIEKLQKTAVRIISNSKYNAHSEPLFKKLALLNISDIYKISILKFYFKYKNNMLPAYFNSIFESSATLHDYNTRNRQQSLANIPRTVSVAKAIRYTVPNVIQITPDNIIQKIYTHSLSGFSLYTKKHFCDQYSATCTIQNCYICNSD